MLATQLFKRLITFGALEIVDANGKRHRFEGSPGPEIAIQLHDRSLYWKLFVHPELYIGEGYMDGTLTIEKGTLHGFLDLCVENVERTGYTRARRFYKRLQYLFVFYQHYNPVGRAQKKVSYHYDLSDELSDLFLDADCQYSCAYFTEPAISLEDAQVDKMCHLAAKLLLQPGMKVLDIGSGWDGLGIYLAREAGVEVTGVTLSTEQQKVSQARAAEAGLAGRARFKLLHYRLETGTFDRIVSVGMFEHVGNPHYSEFFDKLAELLAEDGVALLHSIGQYDGPDPINPWVRKYIFPGGYTPPLSKVMPAIEESGLLVTDVELLRFHYADTLREWNRRFQAQRDKAHALYDERFCRMWQFYLQGYEVAFRKQAMMVFQIQLAKSKDVVPQTRDCIAAWERNHPRDAANTMAA